jgi:hypothetical protein
MTILIKTAVTAAIVALVAAPAMAHEQQGRGHDNEHAAKAKPPGPRASLPAKARAYGRYCQGFSKKHVAGTKGTPFSRCVTAMARLGSNRTDSPRIACRELSKRHVKGQKGTPFSRCVVAGAQLLKDEREDSVETEEAR